jgi:hypothetical protein
MHVLASPITYGLGFWCIVFLLPPPLGGLLPPLLSRPLPPPPTSPLLGGLLPPLLKGPPPSLLIGIIHPPINDLLTSPIRDGFPLQLWYDFSIGMIHGILTVCFLSE